MSVHVLPVGDAITHTDTPDCVCGPDVEYADPEDGVTYPDGPLVIHHSLDGREARE